MEHFLHLNLTVKDTINILVIELKNPKTVIITNGI